MMFLHVYELFSPCVSVPLPCVDFLLLRLLSGSPYAVCFDLVLFRRSYTVDVVALCRSHYGGVKR